MSEESHPITDPIEECIRAVTSAESRQSQDRAWELRCDDIRRRDLSTNWQAIQDATKQKFDRLHEGLPHHRLEFITNPARHFIVRNGDLVGVTVTAEMSADGALLTIAAQRHNSPNDVQSLPPRTVHVQVQGNETYYTYGHKPVTVADIAVLILRPVIESLTAKQAR